MIGTGIKNLIPHANSDCFSANLGNRKKFFFNGISSKECGGGLRAYHKENK